MTKKAKPSVLFIDSAKNLMRSRLDFSGVINDFLRVLSPAPGIMPDTLVHSASA